MEQLVIHSFFLGVVVTLSVMMLIKSHFNYKMNKKIRESRQVIRIADRLPRGKVKTFRW